MTHCRACPKERIRSQRPYQSVPRQMKYSTTIRPTEPQLYYPAKRGRSPIRYNPTKCESCYIKQDLSETYPFESLCYPPPSCPDTCYCCTENSDYGFLSSLRNGFQKIFNGSGNKKRNCSPSICRDKVYRYSASQLKVMEKLLSKFEDEAMCIDESIKEALDCNFRVNCFGLKCSKNSISDQLGALKSDLNCALDCYDPCRDKYEFEFICSLMDRANCLESLLYDLCLQLDCLECYPTPCVTKCRVKKTVCKPNCMKPCCYRPVTFCPPSSRCEPCQPTYNVNCRRAPCPSPQHIKSQKPCCVKVTANTHPRKWRTRVGSGDQPHHNKASLGQTSSVIPLGVMLVKL